MIPYLLISGVKVQYLFKEGAYSMAELISSKYGVLRQLGETSFPKL